MGGGLELGPHGEKWVCGISLHLGCPCGSWGIGNLRSAVLAGGALVQGSRERSTRGAQAGALGGRLMGVGSGRRRGLGGGGDRSLSLGPPRPGGYQDLVPSPAVSGMGVGLEVGRGAAGVCPRSLGFQLCSGPAPQDEPARTAEVRI